MRVRELNRTKCKSYLVSCDETRQALLIDPLRDRLDRYLALLAYDRLTLALVVDTHTHADHRSAALDLRELVGSKTVMHRSAPSPHVDIHVDDEDTIAVGQEELTVYATPGHTPDSICLVGDGYAFTGDTLLIRGTGRADFQGGDAGAQWDGITHKLFTLPDETLVLPAHDYRGNTRSTIGDEKRLNPRLAGKTREEYVEIMSKLGLPLPDKIQEVLQPNQTALDDDRVKFPTLAELNQVAQLTPAQVSAILASGAQPLLLDVREPEERGDELGHIEGSVLVPLRDLPFRAGELERWQREHVIAICRSGVRSTTAAAILTGLGFEQVSNLKGGMVAWMDAGLPTQR